MLDRMDSERQPDLQMIGEALEDRSFERAYWFDPLSGEVIQRGEYDDDLEEDPEEAGWLPIEPAVDDVGYGDMQLFIEALPDSPAAETLARTIQGRGAFRRFKDVLFGTFPQHVPSWHAFKDERQRARAIEWLQDQGLVAPGAIPMPEARPPELAADPMVAYEQLVYSLGSARAAAAVLAEHDYTVWGEVVRLLDAVNTTASRAEPPA